MKALLVTKGPVIYFLTKSVPLLQSRIETDDERRRPWCTVLACSSLSLARSTCVSQQSLMSKTAPDPSLPSPASGTPPSPLLVMRRPSHRIMPPPPAVTSHHPPTSRRRHGDPGTSSQVLQPNGGSLHDPMDDTTHPGQAHNEADLPRYALAMFDSRV
jgi:hypothetical protein